MSKRLTKTIWYGSDVDSNGNPILPSTHGGLDGLNYGELFLHLSNGKATLWTLSSDGKIVEITGGGSEVDMSSYLLKSIWDKVFEIRTDSQGTEYIFGKLPMVTQYGITMYSGDGVVVPSLASGLPFDGRTIWYNPNTNQIEVIGGTGGGSGEGVSNFWDLSGIPSWITNTKPTYSYSEIEGTPDLSGYATESWVLGKSYITSATLGTELAKYVTLDTDQPLKGKKDFKNGLSIDGLGLRKSQDDVIYIDANLVVRGGVTMYAQNEVDIPSIIDAIPTASTTVNGIASFDGNYFSVDANGKVSLIASNVGLNEEELYNYLTSNNYAKKTDIPSLVGYATQSWVNTRIDSLINGAPAAYDTLKEIADVLQGNVNSIGDIITALGTKWTQDNTKIANWDTAYSWGNHANVGYALKSYVDSTFVTLGSTQTITGEKNFTGGLKVNGSPIYYDTEKKYWKLEGDLLVTGGVTMYGSDSSFTPSTIMDAIAVDGTTISKDGGILKVIGGTGGGVADSVAWDNITGKPTWIGSSKPSYSYSEITGAIGTTELQNYLTQNSYLNVTSGDNRYLMLSGGTLTLENGDSFKIRRNKSNSYGAYIAYETNDGMLGRLGMYRDDVEVYFGSQTAKAYRLLHEGNYSNYALPLSGGTMNGIITMPINYQIQWGSSSMMMYGEDTNAIKIVAPLGLYVNSKEVWHKGNFTPSDYLPLSGGTITNGSIIISSGNDKKLILNNTDSDTNYSKIDFQQNGVSIGQLGVQSVGTTYLAWTGDGWNHRILHAGNYSSYALPLSGGTMTGDIEFTIPSGKNTSLAIKFTAPNINYLYVKADELYFGVDSKSTGKIWHSDNDGSGSGLDADLLDGNDGSWYLYNVLGFARQNYTNNNAAERDANAFINGMLYNYGSTNYWKNAPSGFSYGQILSLSSGNDTALMGQLAWDVNHESTTDTTKTLWWRCIQNKDRITYAKWHQIAFTDSNVASATKLQTARTIWGQSFDGTGNVSGNVKGSYFTIGDRNNAYIELLGGSYYGYVQILADGSMAVGKNTSSSIIVNQSGNVGIGTTNPSSKLHVEGSMNLTGEYKIGGYDVLRCYNSALEVGRETSVYQSYSTNIWGYGINFYNKGGTRLLAVTNDGNFGFGVANPISKLHVNGVLTLPLNNQVQWADSGGAMIYGTSNKRIILDGNVGIKTTSPNDPLHVVGDISTYTPSGTYNASVNFANSTNDRWQISGRFNKNNSTENNRLNTYYYNGSTWSNIMSLFTSGDMLVSGGITMYSDQRKKTILNHVELSLKQIADAPLVEHYYNSDESKTTHVGSIAQYWASMNDWFCKLDSEGYYTMEIQNAALASAISIARELDRYETKTDKAIKKLKKRICELEEEVERLKSA